MPREPLKSLMDRCECTLCPSVMMNDTHLSEPAFASSRLTKSGQMVSHSACDLAGMIQKKREYRQTIMKKYVNPSGVCVPKGPLASAANASDTLDTWQVLTLACRA